MARRRLKGKVVSDKVEKTVVVAVERVFAHPVYKKLVKVTKRFKVHDESGAKVGDEVMIEETRPLSKEKRWRVVEVGGKKVAGEQRAIEAIKTAKAIKAVKKSKVKRKKKRTKK